MKKVLSSILFLVLLVAVQSCSTSNNNPTARVNVVDDLLTSVSGWTVIEARFGSEDAPSTMYTGYRIKFNKDGSYTITRPNAKAVNPNRSNPNNFGVWRSDASGGNVRFLLLDGSVNMQVLNTPSTNQLELQWFVSIPGKTGAEYYWKLRAVN